MVINMIKHIHIAGDKFRGCFVDISWITDDLLFVYE